MMSMSKAEPASRVQCGVVACRKPHLRSSGLVSLTGCLVCVAGLCSHFPRASSPSACGVLTSFASVHVILF